MENIERYFIWQGGKITIHNGYISPSPNVINLIGPIDSEVVHSMLIISVPQLSTDTEQYTFNAKFTDGLPNYGKILFAVRIGKIIPNSFVDHCVETLYVEIDNSSNNGKCSISSYVKNEFNETINIQNVKHFINDDNIVISTSCYKSKSVISILNTNIIFNRNFKHYTTPEYNISILVINLSSIAKFNISDFYLK